MNPEILMLVLVIVTALTFDFTNGFHDTANAMATSIATGALKPKAAVILSATLNLVGAFLSVAVALTVTNSVVKIQSSDGSPIDSLIGTPLLLIVLCGLVGGVLWNLLTWFWGLPSSSSHSLFGGLIGAAIASLGMSGVNWVGSPGKFGGVIGKVILPAVVSPLIAGIVSAAATFVVYAITKGVNQRYQETGFRWGQIGSASLVSLAHGTNDAQKTMGVITLALLGAHQWTSTTSIPWWVKVVCATAIAAGTYTGGWRVIRTLGKGLVEIAPPQGMAAESASAATILVSSHLGFALSTTHVATGSILGSGVGRPGAQVRWNVAGRMCIAWLMTLPIAAIVGALTWFVAHLLGDVAGPIAVFVVLIALSTLIFVRAQKNKIDHTNVNDDWDAEAPAAKTAPAAMAH